SLWVVVRPQATLVLWPSTRNGTPGAVAPTRVRPGASMRARYQTPGASSDRCGSLARIGAPVSVRLPARAQTLEAPVGCNAGGSRLASCVATDWSIRLAASARVTGASAG